MDDQGPDRLPFYWTENVQMAEDHLQAIDTMMAARGGIVNAYAQVEYLFADTVVRCAALEAYADIDTTLPYRLDQRVQRFKALLLAEGPLSERREGFERVIEDFQSAEERRQFLVHGFATFHFTPKGDMAMRFDRFMPSRDEPAGKRSMWFRPATLTRIRDETSANTQFALGQFAELHARLGWVGD